MHRYRQTMRERETPHFRQLHICQPAHNGGLHPSVYVHDMDGWALQPLALYEDGCIEQQICTGTAVLS
ncbi:MAG: hypothetical protein CVU22_14015 [Betaproteobacteria bacterium HGW-Betaproteobacteria-16]|nr:MAG: hypothetical protein CVU22_14015 [Betaproteobacteria bacterium HGW-Betaproteobacteria-16]